MSPLPSAHLYMGIQPGHRNAELLNDIGRLLRCRNRLRPTEHIKKSNHTCFIPQGITKVFSIPLLALPLSLAFRSEGFPFSLFLVSLPFLFFCKFKMVSTVFSTNGVISPIRISNIAWNADSLAVFDSKNWDGLVSHLLHLGFPQFLTGAGQDFSNRVSKGSGSNILKLTR